MPKLAALIRQGCQLIPEQATFRYFREDVEDGRIVSACALGAAYAAAHNSDFESSDGTLRNPHGVFIEGVIRDWIEVEFGETYKPISGNMGLQITRMNDGVSHGLTLISRQHSREEIAAWLEEQGL